MLDIDKETRIVTLYRFEDGEITILASALATGGAKVDLDDMAEAVSALQDVALAHAINNSRSAIHWFDAEYTTTDSGASRFQSVYGETADNTEVAYEIQVSVLLG